MQGMRDLSFFFTKKKPAPAREEDGWLIMAASKLLLHSSIARCSGTDNCTVVRTIRGNRGGLDLGEHLLEVVVFWGNAGQVKGVSVHLAPGLVPVVTGKLLRRYQKVRHNQQVHVTGFHRIWFARMQNSIE